MSLRSRLLVALIPLFVICLVLADAGTFTAVRGSLLSAVNAQISGSRGSVERSLENTPNNGFPGPGGDFGQQVPQDTFGALYAPDGALISEHTFTLFGGDSTARPNLPGEIPQNQYVDVSGTGGVNSYRLFMGPAVDESGNTLLVAVPLDGVNNTLTTLVLFEAGISGGVTVIMIVLAWYLVRRGLRPLERMAATAESIAASQLNRRVEPSDQRTEVGRLGLALNNMLAQLETSFAERERTEQRLRHFIADASHELRTPLTSMRGYAELLQRAPTMDRHDIQLAMRRIEEETKRMGVLVDDLLLLARLDQGRPLEREPVHLTTLVEDSCADARAAAPERRITAQVDSDIVVIGDEMRLRQVMGNLVRNALVHTPAGTPVEVRLQREDNHAVLSVVDHGPGIPPEQAPRVFERFHRADTERSGDRGGTGLGLSIVAAVVAAHAGDVRLSPTAGGGATFSVSLPLQPVPPPVPVSA